MQPWKGQRLEKTDYLDMKSGGDPGERVQPQRIHLMPFVTLSVSCLLEGVPRPSQRGLEPPDDAWLGWNILILSSHPSLK